MTNPPRPPSLDTRRQPASLRANITWTFVGNAVYAGCQWLMIVMLARLGSTEVVGTFALALAVTAPVIMLATMQLRWVQATNGQEEVSVRDCLTFRCLGMLLAVAACVLVARFSGYDQTTLGVILAVAIAKAFESISDVLYGWYQQLERMEFVSRSLLLRGPLSVAALGCGFAWTNSLLWACVTLALTWALVLVLYDLPQAIWFGRHIAGGSLWPRWAPGELRRLFVHSLPVGLAAGVFALQANIPRYFVERHYGPAELGIFAAMAYVLLAAETFVRAVNQSAMPRLARFLRTQEFGGFQRVVGRLVLLGTACGAAAVVLAVIAGRWFLGHVYGAEYATSPEVLTCMVVATAISFALRPTEVGLRSMRRFWLLLTVHAVGLPPFILLTSFCVSRYGLWGAAVAMLIQAVAHGVITLALYFKIVGWAPTAAFGAEPLRGPRYLRSRQRSGALYDAPVTEIPLQPN